MPIRTSKTDQEYDGKKVAAGDRFTVQPEHVGLLLTLARIEPEEGDPGYVEPAANEASASRARESRRNRRAI